MFFFLTGYRLTTPDRMPRQLGKHMQSCWHQNPNRRPTFASLVISLNQLKREYSEGMEKGSIDTNPASTTTNGILSLEPQLQLKRSDFQQSRPASHSVTTPAATPAISPMETQAPTLQHSSSAAAASSTMTSRLPRLKPVTPVAPGEEGETGQSSGDREHPPPNEERF